MKQVKQTEDEVETKLQEMQQQLEAEREAGSRCGRAHQPEEKGRRKERWKEEERMKLHEEIDGLRQLFFTAVKDMASRSSAMEGLAIERENGS
ncbi:LOW QUALITY PROTEIN: cilium assembly protein DZIP1L [Aegotheles albertisi]